MLKEETEKLEIENGAIIRENGVAALEATMTFLSSLSPDSACWVLDSMRAEIIGEGCS